MPRWGLTRSQRACEPWGLDQSWLAPAKTITDNVHSDIYLTVLEKRLVDSDAFQRLRKVRQLGMAHLVYPSATHTRFSHSLGTLRAAQDLMDAVVSGLSGPRASSNHLFEDWRRAGTDVNNPKHTVFDMCIAEATVLARLGGLLHDLCHVPVGHTIEDDLGVLVPHDENTARFEHLWQTLPREIRSALGDDLTRELRHLILSKEPGSAEFKSKYPFVTDIVGNTICADLIDYIQRDHIATGLPLALGNRFMNDFYVTPKSAVHWPQQMVVRVSRNGQLRPDMITELIKYLRYRYELSERVLYHHAKTAADAMIGKLLEMWRDALWVEAVQNEHPGIIDTNDKGSDISELRRLVIESQGVEVANGFDVKVRSQLETEFLRWSDDGLLDHLEAESQKKADAGGPGSRRHLGIAQLSHMVVNRQLFKEAGRAASDADLAVAKSTYEQFGRPEARRKLEEDAARFAGISPRWKVVLWVPSPRMRMKVAEVLVELDGRVAPLAEMRSISGEATGIVEQHRRLWGVGLYVGQDVSAWRQRAVLAWMKDSMGLAFVDESGKPSLSMSELIAETLISKLSVTGDEREEIFQLVESSALGGENSFVGRIRQVDQLRKAQGIAEGNEFPFDDYV